MFESAEQAIAATRRDDESEWDDDPGSTSGVVMIPEEPKFVTQPTDREARESAIRVARSLLPSGSLEDLIILAEWVLDGSVVSEVPRKADDGRSEAVAAVQEALDAETGDKGDYVSSLEHLQKTIAGVRCGAYWDSVTGDLGWYAAPEHIGKVPLFFDRVTV